MARINHKLDQELATKGLLRISVIAKALKLAPKTVNSWTIYPITKVGGVKYLTWSDVYKDKQSDCVLFNLPTDARTVHSQVTNTKVPAAIKVLSALEKAKSLLTTKVKVHVAVPLLPPPNFIELEKGMADVITGRVSDVPPEIYKEEILAPVKSDDDVLGIPTEYKHLIRRR